MKKMIVSICVLGLLFSCSAFAAPGRPGAKVMIAAAAQANKPSDPGDSNECDARGNCS